MPVKIEVSYSVSMNKSSVWKIKADLLKAVDGVTFVKLRPHDESFCKFVVQDFLDMPKKCRPSLGQCQRWRSFLQCRNSTAAEQFQDATDAETTSLFGSSAKQSKKNAPRVNATKLQEIRDKPEVMEFPVPGIGEAPYLMVSTIRPAHPCDDPFVPLDPDSIEHIVLYMREAGVDIESMLAKRRYGGMDREKGVWRNGNGSVVRKLEVDSDASADEGELTCKVPTRRLKRVKESAEEGNAEALADSTENTNIETLSVPIADA